MHLSFLVNYARLVWVWPTARLPWRCDSDGVIGALTGDPTEQR
jgi:hypothetical protein